MKTITLIIPKRETKFEAKRAPIPLIMLVIMIIIPIDSIDNCQFRWYQYERKLVGNNCPANESIANNIPIIVIIFKVC